MKAGIGYGTDPDPRKAGAGAAEAASAASGPPAFTLVFTTDRYDPREVLEGVKKFTGSSPLIGICGGGIITAEGVLEQGVGVLALAGEELRVATCLEKELSRDPSRAGERAAETLLASGIEEGIVLVLPDGFQANLSEMIRGLYRRMGPDYRYAGGGTGDNLKFFQTYQFDGEEVTSNALAAALLGGLETAVSVGHGWKPMGDPLVITEAREKRVLAIDGLSPYTAYCKRIGDVPASQFPEVGMEHPLGFPDIFGNYLIRDPLKINDDGSIDFVTEVPRHSVGYVMEGRTPDLLATAAEVAGAAAERLPRPKFILLFDCISRYLLMKKEFSREIEIIREKAGKEVPLIGALTFGEVGSYSEAPLFHNKTTVIVLGGDRTR